MGVLLSDVELQQLSDSLASFALTQTATIWRNPTDVTPALSSLTSDGQGGFVGVSSSNTTGWDAIYTNVPCAVVELRPIGQEPLQADQLRSKTMKTILFPRNTDVLASDRPEIAGVFYEVINVADPSTYEVFRRVYVNRLGLGAV